MFLLNLNLLRKINETNIFLDLINLFKINNKKIANY